LLLARIKRTLGISLLTKGYKPFTEVFGKK
jgi:hypothetical protein